jgi:hypothetical protein
MSSEATDTALAHLGSVLPAAQLLLCGSVGELSLPASVSSPVAGACTTTE